MRLMILFGGASYEHDVSIVTGCLMYNILKEKYDVYPVYISKEQELYYVKEPSVEYFDNFSGKNKVKFIKSGFKSAFNQFNVDICLICNHGNNGEDGMAKSLLDFYEIPSIGSNLISSAVCMDKYFAYCILKENNIKVVETDFITKDKNDIRIDYPLILKPARLGSSIGIEVCESHSEYEPMSKKALSYDEKVVVQPYLDNIVELNISLYNSKKGLVLSKVEVIDQHEGIYSYENKYSKGDYKKRNYLMDDSMLNKINDIGSKVYNILELDGIVRIDFILHNDELYVNEVNTIPGSLSYYLYDKQFPDIISELINFELYKVMNKRCYIFENNILHHEYNFNK